MSDLKKQFPIYSQLLKLYPQAYRQRYEQEILLAAADMLAEAPTRQARLAVRAQLAIDLPKNVGKQQLIALGEQGFTQLPNYIKYNGLVAALLLMPFVIALLANGVDKIFFGHTLQETRVWQRPYIGLWILYFPILALLLAVGSYVAYATQRGADAKQPVLKRLLDFRHFWPLLVTGVFAFGVLFVIFFHDSGQCWVHTPGYAITHLKQSLQCTDANRVSPPKLFRAAL